MGGGGGGRGFLLEGEAPKGVGVFVCPLFRRAVFSNIVFRCAVPEQWWLSIDNIPCLTLQVVRCLAS